MLLETPVEALGPTVRESVLVDGRSFVVTRPDAVDRLIEHPVVGVRRASDEYQPYWASLWPAARLLAEVVWREPWPADAGPVLEIGCGLGLPGLAALARGLRVIFSDYDAAALRFAADNARANGFADFSLLHLDWRSPPRDWHIPILLASDVLYESSMTEPLADFVRQVLAPQGICLLTGKERVPKQLFQAVFRDRHLEMEESVAWEEGTLYRVRHA